MVIMRLPSLLLFTSITTACTTSHEAAEIPVEDLSTRSANKTEVQEYDSHTQTNGVDSSTADNQRTRDNSESSDRPSVNQRLARIERILNNQGLLDMHSQIRQIQEEVSQLRGKIEEQKHQLGLFQERQRRLYHDVSNRIQRLQTRTVIYNTDETNSALNSESATTDFDSTKIDISGPVLELQDDTMQKKKNDRAPAKMQYRDVSPVIIQSQYREGFQLLEQTRYNQAIRSFKKFLSAYPESEYSDNAQYWVAEAYYVIGDYEPALQGYRKLIQNYPDSHKYTDSLLKIGYSLQELGRMAEARKRFHDLTKKYPGTSAARMAKERMRNLDPVDTETDKTEEAAS